jgi:hypothetical protein
MVKTNDLFLNCVLKLNEPLFWGSFTLDQAKSSVTPDGTLVGPLFPFDGFCLSGWVLLLPHPGPPGSPDPAIAFFGESSNMDPAAVNKAYLPAFVRASFLVSKFSLVFSLSILFFLSPLVNFCLEHPVYFFPDQFISGADLNEVDPPGNLIERDLIKRLISQ